MKPQTPLKDGKMNAMVDPKTIQKYLAGQASDEESQQCEAFLSDPQNEVDFDEIDRDSLLETVRNFSDDTTQVAVNKDLVQQLRSMVPTRPIGQGWNATRVGKQRRDSVLRCSN